MADLDETLEQRGRLYGEFEDNASLSQKLKKIIRESGGWDELSYSHKQALDVIFDKISRIVSGNADYPDNWHDISGYAKLAEDRTRK